MNLMSAPVYSTLDRSVAAAAEMTWLASPGAPGWTIGGGPLLAGGGAARGAGGSASRGGGRCDGRYRRRGRPARDRCSEHKESDSDTWRRQIVQDLPRIHKTRHS